MEINSNIFNLPILCYLYLQSLTKKIKFKIFNIFRIFNKILAFNYDSIIKISGYA